MRLIIDGKSEAAAQTIDKTGGKGLNLLKLAAQGFPVPEFFILSTEACQAYTAQVQKEFSKAVKALDTSSQKKLVETSARVRACFDPAKLPEEWKHQIRESVKTLAQGDQFFAVRSSAVMEDSAEFSFAGLLDSYLFCRTEEQILNAVTSCWASAYSERAVAYRAARGLAQTGQETAVVIQRMIDGRVSGIAFSVNPATGRRNEVLINSVYGIGEGIVSAGLEPDRYLVDRDSYRILEKTIVPKPSRIVFDRAKGHGTLEQNVELEAAGQPTLTDAEVQGIARVFVALEAAYGKKPQDIEWCLDQTGKLYILQSRAITTIHTLRPGSNETKILWDNSNITESYPGVTSPLTYSFALRAYYMVYTQFFQVLRVPPKKILDNDHYLGNMLGYIEGRIYYNLNNWCRLISVLPGYRYNRDFMEGMMGVKTRIDFDPLADQEKIGFFRKYFVELKNLIFSGLSLFGSFLNLKSKTRKFMKITQEAFRQYGNFDFDQVPADRLTTIYYELENRVLRNWKAPIINDFMAMIFYGLSSRLIKKWKVDSSGAILNELLAGQGNVESTRPIRRLQEMARFIRQHPDLLAFFQGHTEAELADYFVKQPRTSEAQEAFVRMRQLTDEYLEDYGFRSISELKLEEPSLHDRPDFIFGIMKNYLRGEIQTEEEQHQREKAIQREAERKVRRALGPVKNGIFRFVLGFAKRAVVFREYQRFARTKMFGVVRKLFQALGRHLKTYGALEEAQDVFLLTREEIFAFVRGTSLNGSLKDLVKLRAQEQARYKNNPEPPDRIETYGIVYCNDFSLSQPAAPQESSDGVFRGQSCCPGLVRGPVKVMLAPNEDMALDGEILVAAKTDPGWVPLYPSAKGLLIERGSMLSHSAIVARELGLPAIVGITGITQVLKTGDWVEMDGAAGTVRLLSKEEIQEESHGQV